MVFGLFLKFKIVEADGQSMLPKIKSNWKLLFKIIKLKHLNRQDVILFDHTGKLLIKRIIGTPNEYVEIKNGAIFINETELKEDYIEIPRIVEGVSKWQLGENEYLLLGDNSMDSLDSRKFGPIVLDENVYRYSLRIWPLRVK